MDAAIKTFGQLDILVNNADLFELAPVDDDFDKKLYQRLFETNVLGTMLVTAAAVNARVCEAIGRSTQSDA